MKKLLFIGIFIGLFTPGIAQSLTEFTYLKDKFHQERYLNFSGMLVQIKNPAAPVNKGSHNQQVVFIDLYFYKPNFAKGGLNRRVDYKLLPDVFWLFKQITEVDPNKMFAEQSSTLTAGIIGWHTWTWNILSKPKNCLSIGLNLNDYFIGSIYSDASNKIILHEPQGWQIGAGPSIGLVRHLNNSFLLIGSSSYTISFAKPVDISYAKADNAYPKPHFLHGNLTLMSKWGFFAEAQFVKLLNQGNLPNSTQRLDLKLGFSFVL